MLLSEMLEYTGKEFLDDRTDLIDGDPDVLWSDTTLVRYFNQAEAILARRAWTIIETGVAPAGLITLATGVSLYKLHKSVLKVYDGTPSTQLSPLGQADDIKLRNPYPPSSDAFDVGSAAAIAGNTLAIPGPPLAIGTDAGTKQVRVAPVPTSTQNGLQIVLKVARLPICKLDVTLPDKSPETAEEYHMFLCDYAAGRCLTMPNVDSQGRGIGKDLLDTWERNVREARQDRQRAGLGGDRWEFASSTSVLR